VEECGSIYLLFEVLNCEALIGQCRRLHYLLIVFLRFCGNGSVGGIGCGGSGIILMVGNDYMIFITI
jgi:hypothetical protein